MSLQAWIDIFILYERGRVTHISIFMNTDALMWNWRHGTRVFISLKQISSDMWTDAESRHRSQQRGDVYVVDVKDISLSNPSSFATLRPKPYIEKELTVSGIKDGRSLKHRRQQSSSLCLNPHSLQSDSQLTVFLLMRCSGVWSVSLKGDGESRWNGAPSSGRKPQQ